MSISSGASVGQAQTQVSVSTAILKRAVEAEQEFVSKIKEAAENTPPPKTVDRSPPPPGTGRNVDIEA